MGRRVQNRGKRNLFLNFFKFRTSGLLTPPPPPLPPMSEFVLIFQTPLGSDILCEWPLRQVDLRNGKGESGLQTSCNKVVVRGAWIVVPLVVPFFGICVYLTSYSWKYYYQCSLAVPKSKIFFPPLAHIPRVKTLFHSSKISTDRKCHC
jgi:hypothetical protein